MFVHVFLIKIIKITNATVLGFLNQNLEIRQKTITEFYSKNNVTKNLITRSILRIRKALILMKTYIKLLHHA